MHRIIEEGLEDCLIGRARRDFSNHLEACAPCRTELSQHQGISALFRESLESSGKTAAPAPPPDFYARLSMGLEARKISSPWSFFSTDAVFGRRVAFASLMTLAVVGGLLISRESSMHLEDQDPEAIIASHESSDTEDVTIDRDRMMVTLASFEQ